MVCVWGGGKMMAFSTHSAPFFVLCCPTLPTAGFVSYVRVFRYRNIGAGIFIGKG